MATIQRNTFYISSRAKGNKQLLLTDPELGTVYLRISPRARHYNLKIAEGVITAVMPTGGDEKTLRAFLEESRPKLLQLLEQKPVKKELFDEQSTHQFQTFQLHIFRTERHNFYMRLDKEVLHIACPNKTDFSAPQVQDLLKSLIERALRHEALRILPSRLVELANQYNFTFNDVKINKSKTRWGSCNSNKGINLSLYLMKVPSHLSDYVLLHELCHTVEMNHSERFWKLMDSVTDGKAHHFRNELKAYNSSL